jgi:hypothetical protein
MEELALFERYLLRDTRSLDELILVSTRVGFEQRAIEDDIRCLITQRLLFWCLSDDTLPTNFIEKKSVIRRRLASIRARLPEIPEEEFEALIAALAGLHSKMESPERNWRQSVSNTGSTEVAALLRTQKGRCAYCGIPLVSAERAKTMLFKDGLEPVASPVLDHEKPFYLFGNRVNRQLTCPLCNGLKGEKFDVPEEGFVFAGNHMWHVERERVRQKMMFWHLVQRPKCGVDGCPFDAKQSLLFARKRLADGPFVYGNIRIICREHAGADAFCLHKGLGGPSEPFGCCHG